MLAAVAAVLTGISAAAPDGPAMITVVKARSQLQGGTVVSAADLVLEQVVASDVPEGVLTDPNDLIGKTLAGPVAEDQMLTPLSTTAAHASVPPGHVIAPLKLGDPALAALVRPGDAVDVIAAGADGEQGAVIAANARVITVPQSPGDRMGGGSESALVLIDVDSQAAAVLAQAAATATLSVIWR